LLMGALYRGIDFCQGLVGGNPKIFLSDNQATVQ